MRVGSYTLTDPTYVTRSNTPRTLPIPMLTKLLLINFVPAGKSDFYIYDWTLDVEIKGTGRDAYIEVPADRKDIWIAKNSNFGRAIAAAHAAK